LDWLADYIAGKGAPEGTALAITDRNGIYLARYPDNGRFVGTRMPSDKYLKMGDRGAVDIVDADGVERIEGYSALQADSGGLVVSFGINKAQAFTEIQNRTQRGILLIALSASLVLVLTSLGARRFIHRPLGQLVGAANQWRLGEYSRRVDIRDKSSIGIGASATSTAGPGRRSPKGAISSARALRRSFWTIPTRQFSDSFGTPCWVSARFRSRRFVLAAVSGTRSTRSPPAKA